MNDETLHFGKRTTSDASKNISSVILFPRSSMNTDDFKGTVTQLAKNYRPKFKVGTRIK